VYTESTEMNQRYYSVIKLRHKDYQHRQ